MRIHYSIEVMNGISLPPLDRDNVRRIRRVALLKGCYSFAWSLSDPAYALLCDLEFKEEGTSETSLGVLLAPWPGGDSSSLLQLESFFDGCLEDDTRTRAGCFTWEAGSADVPVCADLLSHPFAMSEYSAFDDDAALKLGLPAKEGNVEWSFSLSPESPLVAIGRCHSWESWNPVEFWDTETRHQLHVIKDEKKISSATPKYDIAFNANGSLLYFNNGLESTVEIWGCITD